MKTGKQSWNLGPTRAIPVRFPVAMLEEIRRRAESDDRALATWIRRACERELLRLALLDDEEAR